jgi:hypothetical protein
MLAQDLKFYQVEWKSPSGTFLKVVIEEAKLASFVELFLIKGIAVKIKRA